jgi:hypothetical protein
MRGSEVFDNPGSDRTPSRASPTAFGVVFDGLDTSLKTVDALSNDIKRVAIKQAMRQIGLFLAGRMRGHAQLYSGLLARSIGYKQATYGDGAVEFLAVGVLHGKGADVTPSMGLWGGRGHHKSRHQNPAMYAHLLEHGHRIVARGRGHQSKAEKRAHRKMLRGHTGSIGTARPHSYVAITMNESAPWIASMMQSAFEKAVKRHVAPVPPGASP